MVELLLVKDFHKRRANPGPPLFGVFNNHCVSSILVDTCIISWIVTMRCQSVAALALAVVPFVSGKSIRD